MQKGIPIGDALLSEDARERKKMRYEKRGSVERSDRSFFILGLFCRRVSL